MKILTKNTDYAIRALIVMAMDKKKYISIAEISKIQDIPYHFLRKIIQSLIKQELVISKEGAGGGVKINKNPKDIKIIDIIEVFQGEINFSECMFRKKICKNRNTCVLRKEILRIENIVNNEFSHLNIGYLMNKIKQ